MSLVHLPEGLIFRIEDFLADHDRIEEFRNIQEALNFYADGIALLREVRDAIRGEMSPVNGILPPSGHVPPFDADGTILKPRREFLPAFPPPERSNTANLPWIGD